MLGSEIGQIRRILDVGLVDVADAMSWWMEDHWPKVPEEEWQSEDKAEVEEEVRDLAEEKQAFREFLKERARARDAMQAASVGPNRTTEASAGNEGNMVGEVQLGV